MRESRERDRNANAKAFRGIQEDMAELGKELERARDEAGMDGASLASAKAKAHIFPSEINGVRERSEGGEANQRAAVDRAKAASGRERYKAKRLHKIM